MLPGALGCMLAYPLLPAWAKVESGPGLAVSKTFPRGRGNKMMKPSCFRRFSARFLATVPQPFTNSWSLLHLTNYHLHASPEGATHRLFVVSRLALSANVFRLCCAWHHPSVVLGSSSSSAYQSTCRRNRRTLIADESTNVARSASTVMRVLRR